VESQLTPPLDDKFIKHIVDIIPCAPVNDILKPISVLKCFFACSTSIATPAKHHNVLLAFEFCQLGFQFLSPGEYSLPLLTLPESKIHRQILRPPKMLHTLIASG